MLYFLGIKDQPGAFWGFFAMFMILFFATGVGNASTFQMIPAIMRVEVPRLEPGMNPAARQKQADMESAAIIGFTSAIAAYGAFFIPKAYGTSISLTGGPETALWWFMGFYVTCVAVTWGFYTRRGGLLHDVERGNALPPAARNRPNKRTKTMSHFLDRLTFFNRVVDTFSDGHGIVTNEDRRWEDGYRKRWQHDKIVRSTHGVNCTGSCSWKIYVKGGIVTWETQQTDYPRTRPDLPNHEPRGCSRGASYSWYLYSAQPREISAGALAAAQAVARGARRCARRSQPGHRSSKIRESAALHEQARGLGGFVRATWDEVNEIIAAANAYTVKKYGPDRVIGFSPIPAMSMVSLRGRLALSVAARRRLHVVLRLVLRPAAVPARKPGASRPTCRKAPIGTIRAFSFCGVPTCRKTRTPDAHFYTEAPLSRRQERRDQPGLFAKPRNSSDCGSR